MGHDGHVAPLTCQDVKKGASTGAIGNLNSNQPKVFISYSWSSETHKELVRTWADRLIGDGVEVVVDVYDLKEGDDKHAFMERSVRDSSVTHVLIVCDQTYAQKADARSAGVGTETQLISKEVYEKVVQSKFIPIICSFDELGNPHLPAFLASRIGVDFSTNEKTNGNWEQLIRLLVGKPRLVKPALGKLPLYLSEDSAAPPSPARAKLEDLRQSLLGGKSSVGLFRRSFLDACIMYADALRVRERPKEDNPAKKVMEDYQKLIPIRDHIVDWVLLESSIEQSQELSDALVDMLEQLREVKGRPVEVTAWNNTWFEAHELFVYETFLYVVAALIRTRAYLALREVFTSHYMRAKADRYGDQKFDTYSEFYAHSDLLQKELAPAGQRLYSPAAELLKRNAQRGDLTFDDLIEADLLVLFVSLAGTTDHWYPALMHYADRFREFPLFIRATRHKYFKGLATIVGIDDANAIREAIAKGYQRSDLARWGDFRGQNLLHGMNLDALDSL